MKIVMILLYFLTTIFLADASENGKDQSYQKANEELLEIPKCAVCHEQFPVTMTALCNHEFCALCVENIHIGGGVNKNCPLCRIPMSQKFYAYKTEIYPINNETEIKKIDLQKILPILCSKANIELISTLVKKYDLDVKARGVFQYLPIHLSHKQNIAEFLRQRGANVHDVGPEGTMPLGICSELGNLEMTEYLVEQCGAKVNEIVRNDGATALWISARLGHIKNVYYLTQNGADIHTVNDLNLTPLWIAAAEGHLSIVKYLKKKGAKINHRNSFGCSPLLVAAKANHLDIVEYLVRMGARVNQKNNHGLTPLWLCCDLGNLEILKFLINQGAKLNLSIFNGITPLGISAKSGHLPIVEYLVNEMKVSVNEPNTGKGDITPLIISSYQGHLKIVKFLLSKNANVNQPDNSGATPLFSVCTSEIEAVHVAKLLIENGANIDQINNSGFTPLAIAIKCGLHNMAKFLIQQNANVKETAARLEQKNLYQYIKILNKLSDEEVKKQHDEDKFS